MFSFTRRAVNGEFPRQINRPGQFHYACYGLPKTLHITQSEVLSLIPPDLRVYPSLRVRCRGCIPERQLRVALCHSSQSNASVRWPRAVQSAPCTPAQPRSGVRAVRQRHEEPRRRAMIARQDCGYAPGSKVRQQHYATRRSEARVHRPTMTMKRGLGLSLGGFEIRTGSAFDLNTHGGSACAYRDRHSA